MKENSDEIWRNIPGYEGFYQGSTWGRVKSLERVDSLGRVVPERILKPVKLDNDYLKVNLWKEGKKKQCYVHRLIAEAFIPNDDPEHKTQVNHINEDKTDNRVVNLNWMRPKENTNWGTGIERMAKAHSKRVAQYTLDGKLVKIWESLSEITRQTGWNKGNISQCCLGKTYSQCYGFIWRYV